MMSRMPQPSRRERRSQSLVTRERSQPDRPAVVVREREFLEFGEGVAAHVVEDAGRDLAAQGDEEARADGDDHRPRTKYATAYGQMTACRPFPTASSMTYHRQQGQEADLAGAVHQAAHKHGHQGPLVGQGVAEDLPPQGQVQVALELLFLGAELAHARASAAPPAGPSAWRGEAGADRRFLVQRVADRGLDLPQAPVQAVLADELLVRPGLDDAAAVQDDDGVGGLQGREAVGDDQRRAPAVPLVQGLKDHRLGLGVDGAQGVVEDEDRRVLEDRPRQGHALALAAGERHAALAHQRVVALLELLDVVVDAGEHSGLLDLVVADGAAGPEADVVADGLGVQERFLHDDAEEGPGLLAAQVAQFAAVDPDGAVAVVVEPQEQMHQRGLARPRRPHDGQGLAGLDLEGDVAQGVSRCRRART